jgi:hypothetical protein
MTSLNERTVLTCLHIGSYNGKAVDREITEEVSEQHHADLKDAGRYSKQLIATKFLKPVTSKISNARRIHRLLTLPWDDDARILSNTGFNQYTETMRLQRLGVEAAAAEFVAHWAEFINEARTRLGNMFSYEDYPVAEVVGKKFYVDVEIKPVPAAGDFRAELSDAHVKAVTKDIERRTEERLGRAMDDVFERIQDATSKMVEKLRAYKPRVIGEANEGVFRDSLVYNLRELAELIPALNITNDKRLDELHTRLLADCTKHEPDELREDEKLRRKTADAAEKILAKVNSYLA